MRLTRCNTFKIICVFLVAAILAATVFAVLYIKNEGVRFVSNMGVGWNLGNTLDAHGRFAPGTDVLTYETGWGNPVTTKKIIAAVKASGFLTLRIPVTWYEHLDAQNQIDPTWLARVQQVVDMGLDCGMYVILDMHHENWLSPTYNNAAAAEARLTAVWAQIAARFAQYDTRLLFEGMNEPRISESEAEWTGGTPEEREVVNRLNLAFYNTVRSADGYNSERYLLLTTYAGSSVREALAALQLPNDRRVIVSVHAYLPYQFALNEQGTNKWSVENPKDTQPIENTMKNLYELFVKRGTPVLITEFGAINKQNEATRAAYVAYYMQTAAKYKIGCVWWDEGGLSEQEGALRLLDRRTLQWLYPDLLQSLVGHTNQNT